MKKDEITEVSEAVILLKKSEKSSDPKSRIRDFEAGIDILNAYLEEIPNVSDETKAHISNLKISYTRQILRKLSELGGIEMDVWFEYTRVLSLKVQNERDTIMSEYSDLAVSYKEFLDLWRNEFFEVIGFG